MNRTTTLSCLALVTALLSACAVNNQSTGTRGLGLTYQSAIKPMNDGSFFVEAEAAPLAGRQSGADAVVTEQATNFCDHKKQKMVVVKKDFDSNLLVNGVVRLNFRCE